MSKDSLIRCRARRDESGDRLGRERDYYGPQHWPPPAELSDVSEEMGGGGGHGAARPGRGAGRGRSKGAGPRYGGHQPEDPYYHGLSARVPAFPAPKVDKETHGYSQAAR